MYRNEVAGMHGTHSARMDTREKTDNLKGAYLNDSYEHYYYQMLVFFMSSAVKRSA